MPPSVSTGPVCAISAKCPVFFSSLRDIVRARQNLDHGALMLEQPQDQAVKWAKVIDQTRCIGCHACTTACKSENLVPLSVTRTYVKHVDVGVFPQARRAHQVTRCNQCAHAPCVTACPTTAMFKRADGIVDFDKSICIGCKACMAVVDRKSVV